MKKKEYTIYIGAQLDIGIDIDDAPFCINKLIEYLNKAKEDGATNVEMYCFDITNEIEIHPIKTELETDEAFEKRKAEEESRKLAAENVKKAKERALYEELKLKYG